MLIKDLPSIIAEWAKEECAIQNMTYDINQELYEAFNFYKSKKGSRFWCHVNNGSSLSALKADYSELPWVHKCPRQFLFERETRVPLYNSRIRILLGDNDLDFNEYFDFKNEKFHAHTIVTHDFTGSETINICFNILGRSGVTHGVIAHEAMHTSFIIANRKGLEFNSKNHEALCYLHEWIVDKIYDFIKEKELYSYVN